MHLTDDEASLLRVLVKLRNAAVNTVAEAKHHGVSEPHLHLALLRAGAPPSLPLRLIELLVRGGVLRRAHARLHLGPGIDPKGSVGR